MCCQSVEEVFVLCVVYSNFFLIFCVYGIYMNEECKHGGYCTDNLALWDTLVILG